VENARQRLFAGEKVNYTEDRPIMHMAMRSDGVLAGQGKEIAAGVNDNRQRMFEFAAGHSQ